MELISLGYRQQPRKQRTISAAGTATIPFGPPIGGRFWVPQWITINGTSALNGICFLYIGGMSAGADTSALNFVEGSASGASDTWTADNNGLVMYPEDLLTLAWSGMTPGSLITARFHYEELAPTGGQYSDPDPTIVKFVSRRTST